MATEIIALYSPAQRHGKSTIAQILNKNGWTIRKFASPLKCMLSSFLDQCGLEPVDIDQMLEGEMKDIPTTYLGGKTPRHALQTLGTEWGRGLIDDRIWVKAAANAVLNTPGPVVIDDMRFPNEYEEVNKLKGKTVRVSASSHGRPPTVYPRHASEGALESFLFDVEIINDGSISDLEHKVNLELLNSDY